MRIVDWNRLGEAARGEVLARPAQAAAAERHAAVAAIIERVRQGGDAALRQLTAELDGVVPDALAVSQGEMEQASAHIDPALRRAMDEAAARITAFHRAALPQAVRLETAPGVVCERIPRAITRVGLYVPAGSAPLPSTALMLGLPARLAGCREVVLCSPPRADGRVDPAVLHATRLCGITRVFRLGGAQAIAAMALGSDSVPRCDKLFGPGNAWVTEAKQQVSLLPAGPAIDMPAGPSEVLVIADDAADAGFVAADLLSQAEHGPDSQVILLTPSPALAAAVADEVDRQLSALSRRAVAEQALQGSRIILVDSLLQAIGVSNMYAPEHLIVHTRAPRELLDRVDNAGSVFLGPWSPESVGDYCSGTNHVLPTGGHARALSGVSVTSFMKFITVQELDAEGLRHVGPCAVTLARAEGLTAHAQAVELRLQKQGAVA